MFWARSSICGNAAAPRAKALRQIRSRRDIGSARRDVMSISSIDRQPVEDYTPGKTAFQHSTEMHIMKVNPKIGVVIALLVGAAFVVSTTSVGVRAQTAPRYLFDPGWP